MATAPDAKLEGASTRLTLTRIIKAPRTLVWQAWTEPKHLAAWWGPKDFTNPRCEFEARKGGAIRIDMRGPDGVVYPMTGVVRDIAPPERLEFLCTPLDGAGKALFDVLNIVTLADQNGDTRLSLDVRVLAIHAPIAQTYLKGMSQGWSESLDRLERAATKANAVHASFAIERHFAASPQLVFAAFATEEGKAAWFSAPPGKWSQVRRDFDFRVGGREALVGRWESGTVTAFDAVYHDIVPERRIVYSYSMQLDERRISVSLATIELVPDGSGTRLKVTEQGVFLDGYEDGGSRKQGTGDLLDRLGAALAGEAARA